MKLPPPQQMENANYLTTVSTWPQTSWRLRTDSVNPCNTTLLPHHQPIRIVHKLITYPATPPSLTWLLKVLCQNPLGSSGLLGHEPPISLHGFAIKLSLFQTPTFQFVWSHCAPGTLLTILASQPGVHAHGRSTPAWGSPLPELPAAAGAHFALGISEGLSPSGAGRPWHEAVWSQETSGAVVHIWCYWVSRSSLRNLGIPSTPYGLLPLWEVSHSVCLRVHHSSVYNWEQLPPSIWAFPLRDKPSCLIGVPCWRGELLLDSTRFGNWFILRARPICLEASIWEWKWNFRLHL